MPHHLLEGICDDLLGDATRRVYRLHATYNSTCCSCGRPMQALVLEKVGTR